MAGGGIFIYLVVGTELDARVATLEGTVRDLIQELMEEDGDMEEDDAFEDDY